MKKYLVLMVVLFAIPINAYALTNSTIQCNTNQTLEENITIYVDGNASTLSLYTFCSNDCDNVTRSCNPLEYEASVFNMILIVVAIGGMYMIYRFARSRI